MNGNLGWNTIVYALYISRSTSIPSSSYLTKMEVPPEKDLDAQPLPPQAPERSTELSSELEDILCDKDVPLFRRLKKAAWVELKVLFRLAAPAIGVYMVAFGMSTSTQIMSGHLGNLELAAASLGNNGIQMFAYGILVCQQVLSLPLNLPS